MGGLGLEESRSGSSLPGGRRNGVGLRKPSRWKRQLGKRREKSWALGCGRGRSLAWKLNPCEQIEG